MLASRRVKSGTNPVISFTAMIEDGRSMRAKSSDIEDEGVCLLFLRALLDRLALPSSTPTECLGRPAPRGSTGPIPYPKRGEIVTLGFFRLQFSQVWNETEKWQMDRKTRDSGSHRGQRSNTDKGSSNVTSKPDRPDRCSIC